MPDVPPEVVEIIGLALRKDPKDRWQSMQVMYTVLAAQKAKFDSGVMSSSSFGPPVSRPVSRPASQPPWQPPSQPPAQAPLEPPHRKRGNKWIWIAIGLGFAYWGTCGRSSRNVRVRTPRVDVPDLSIEASPPAPAVPGASDAPLPEKKGSSVLTNQSIIEMVGAEVPESVIIGHIRASKTKFDLSTAAIITLSKNDVPPAVIEAMRNPTG